MTAFTPTAAQRENIRAALRMLRQSGAKFRQAAVSFANQGAIAGANKTVNDLWHDLASFKDKIQQKSPQYMRDLRNRLRQFSGKVEDKTKSAARKAKTSARRHMPGKKSSASPKRPTATRRKTNASKRRGKAKTTGKKKTSRSRPAS